MKKPLDACDLLHELCPCPGDLNAYPLTALSAEAQKTAWRQATDSELAALLPARAPVEKEHIETEMRTASGITDGKGHFIAGVVLITAGYSADGKYSHYLVVQAPIRIGGINLAPGEYVFGWQRDKPDGDTLSVHLHEALTGKLLGVAQAHKNHGQQQGRIAAHLAAGATSRQIQIGRFVFPYELTDQ